MFWPGMAGRYTKMGALLSIVVKLRKEKLAELEKNSAKSKTKSKFLILNLLSVADFLDP